jgi:hypothetical protein
VPCRSDIDEVRNTVLARCAVAPRELYASEGPYTVSVSYAGRGELTPVSVSFTQYVVPAVSTTRLRVPTVVSAGRALSFTALVSGVPTVRADAAVGAVRFSVRGPSGRVLHCRGGDTASLSATGRATCTLAAPPQIGTLYVAAGYRGDSNFSASTSRTRSISVRQAT